MVKRLGSAILLSSETFYSITDLGNKGLFAGAKPGLVWADASTTDRNQTIALGKQAAEKGVIMLEGTMTGGMMALRNNKMVCLAGGDEKHFNVSIILKYVTHLLCNLKNSINLCTRITNGFWPPLLVPLLSDAEILVQQLLQR